MPERLWRSVFLSLGHKEILCLTVTFAGPINTFLSASVFFPLSRITFSAYLVHMHIIYLLYNSFKSVGHYTGYLMVGGRGFSFV